jgi:hypothetical protein
MFTLRQIVTTINNITFRKKAKRESDPQKFVEVTVETPLDKDGAYDLKPFIPDILDLFTKGGEPKVDLRDVSFESPKKLWILELRSHEEIKRPHKIANITLRRVNAYKAEGGTWILGFTLSFILGDMKDVTEFLRFFAATCTMRFEEQDPGLPMDDGEPAPSDEQTHDVTPSGNVENIRGRKKKPADEEKTH